MNIGFKLAIALLMAGLFPLHVIAACVVDVPAHSCCPKRSSETPVDCHKTGCISPAPAALPSFVDPAEPFAPPAGAISDRGRAPVLQVVTVRRAPRSTFDPFVILRCLRI